MAIHWHCQRFTSKSYWDCCRIGCCGPQWWTQQSLQWWKLLDVHCSHEGCEVLHGKIYLGSLQSRPLGTMLNLTYVWHWYSPPFIFLAVSRHLSYANFPSNLDGINQSRFFRQYPHKTRIGGHSFCSSLPLSGKLMVLNCISIGDGIMHAKWNCDSYTFCVVFLGFCFVSSTVLLQLLNWTPELSQSYFHSWTANCFPWNESLDLYSAILLMPWSALEDMCVCGIFKVIPMKLS